MPTVGVGRDRLFEALGKTYSERIHFSVSEFISNLFLTNRQETIVSYRLLNLLTLLTPHARCTSFRRSRLFSDDVRISYKILRQLKRALCI